MFYMCIHTCSFFMQSTSFSLPCSWLGFLVKTDNCVSEYYILYTWQCVQKVSFPYASFSLCRAKKTRAIAYRGRCSNRFQYFDLRVLVTFALGLSRGYEMCCAESNSKYFKVANFLFCSPFILSCEHLANGHCCCSWLSFFYHQCAFITIPTKKHIIPCGCFSVLRTYSKTLYITISATTTSLNKPTYPSLFCFHHNNFKVRKSLIIIL